jgi:hypothetical protein
VTRLNLELLEDRLALSGYTFSTIDVPNARSTEADAINARGQIVQTFRWRSGLALQANPGGLHEALPDSADPFPATREWLAPGTPVRQFGCPVADS